MIHKTTRSILSVLLAVLLLVTSIPLTPAFAGEGGGAVSLQSESGEGRALKPAADGTYLIYTAENLKEFAAIVNGTAEGIKQNTSANAKLMNDIDLNGSEENPWTPIGSDSNEYTGTFNGQNFKISGLNINSSSNNYQGLFGYVGTRGTVQNLSVSGTVSGGMFVGGVVGYNRGNVINCYNTGTVSGNSYVGGVVGVVGDSSGTVKNCYNTGTVTGSGGYVGGVAGQNSGSVENCTNTGAVSGPDSAIGSYVGGVVGRNDGSVENCYNTGSVTSSGLYFGGVVGYNSVTVKNCYNTGTVSSNSNISDVGGVVGYNSGTVTNCYNTGTVSSNSDNSDVGGVVGENSSSGTVTGCYFLSSTAASGIGSGRGDATSVTTLNELCEALENNTTWTIHPVLGRPVLNKNWEGGLGTDKSPYEISTADELKNFATAVNGGEKSAHAKLMNDIDLNPDMKISEDGTVTGAHDQWIPIGNDAHQYIGTFDGNGNTIENLYINNTDSADYQGLFGYVGSSGTVQNLSVSGSVSGNNYVGGVVGDNRGSVEDCDFTGSVTSTVDYVGGVVGYNGGTVKNCYNTGNISGNISGNTSGNQVGGIVGQNFGGTVENCYNTGNISGDISIDISGGVVGWNDSGTVKNCYNTGNIGGNTSGGVVGYNHSGGSVTNSYNTGAVSGDEEVGGVVGWNDSGTVKNCYNIGDVSGKISVGGVVGLNNGTVENCYFLQTTEVNDKLQGIGGGSGTSSNVEARTADAFHSGEVAYLLQSKQTAGSSQVWGQSALGTEDSLPTLVALDKANAQKVYRLTFNWNMGDQQPDTVRYTNGSVTLPADNEIPTRTGYHISGWKDKNGQPVTAETTVEEDAVFTAEWTANTYTITVTAGSGGTVSGSGEYSEGTQVTVTATPATGYHFVNWTENGTEVSTEATFTFNATVDRNLIAIFAKNEEPEPTPTPTPTPDPTPSGPSTGDSSGWDDIRDELENAAKGDEITIDMGDETKVPAEIFESLAGKDVEISFDLGDIQWSVNGADIPTDTDFTDLDMGVTMNSDGIPVNVINTITGERDTVQMTLAHNGDFGFTMTLTAPLGVENAGYWANLYHYDEDAEQLTFETAAEIDADGNAALPLSHASQYAIVIDTHSHATVDVSDIFLDIAPDAWYKDAIQYAYDHGLMTGVSATEFAPEQTTTRAMIVSILARLEGVTTAEAAGFADVNDEWYATAVNWAANVGVVNGYEDNTFRPNTAITREQLAAILMNYAAYKGEDVSNRADLTSYTDQPSTWAQEAMQWAVAEGLISGVTNTELQPQGNATRAQVAAILQRFLSE